MFLSWTISPASWFYFFKPLKNFFMCMSVLLTYMCSQNRILDPLDLAHKIVSSYVSAGNKILVLCKSSLIMLSSSSMCYRILKKTIVFLKLVLTIFFLLPFPTNLSHSCHFVILVYHLCDTGSASLLKPGGLTQLINGH